MVLVGTTDVHGWFNGHEEERKTGGEEIRYGGLALLSSYVDALRAVADRIAAQAGPGEQVEAYVSKGTNTSVDAYQGEIESLTQAGSARTATAEDKQTPMKISVLAINLFNFFKSTSDPRSVFSAMASLSIATLRSCTRTSFRSTSGAGAPRTPFRTRTSSRSWPAPRR